MITVSQTSTTAVTATVRPSVRHSSELLSFRLIIRPHRGATYVDAAHCYRLSSVVCWLVCLSVRLSFCHTSEPAKTAAPIEMPFGRRTRVGPGNHVLDGGPDIPREGVILRGKGAVVVKFSDTLS